MQHIAELATERRVAGVSFLWPPNYVEEHATVALSLTISACAEAIG
jgi:hypothetical protein